VPGTEVSFANGVAVSLDDRVFALAGTYSSSVLLVDRHTGVPVTGVDPCRDPKAVPCGFPFAIVQIHRQARVSVLFQHDGSRIPGALLAAALGIAAN
jgi:hypothetical protein